MTTFARVTNNVALDCQIAATATELAARFHPDWLAANPLVMVPDLDIGGKPIAHGAVTSDGGVSFRNPAVVPVALIDKLLSRADLIAHCVSQFGSNTRWGAVIYAAKTASDPAVAGMYEQYTALPAVAKAQAQAFFTAIRAATLPAGSVVTVAEITAIITNWPQG